MSYYYSENILVRESAGNLLRDELGWDMVFVNKMVRNVEHKQELCSLKENRGEGNDTQ